MIYHSAEIYITKFVIVVGSYCIVMDIEKSCIGGVKSFICRMILLYNCAFSICTFKRLPPTAFNMFFFL